MKLYLDSSAIVKLVQRETESNALRRYLRQHRADEKVTSELARVEVVRAVYSGGDAAIGRARRQLARLYLVSLTRDLLEDAATLAPGTLVRSLDAIHVASAQLLRGELRALVTYDERMTSVARALDLEPAAPS
ncbi:MAG: type II toxin-antitoxin system VapC family toxin [Acidimicrobiales bacterium]